MPHATSLRGSGDQNLNPGGPGVESTARNCRNQLRKRVADRKHGIESRSVTAHRARHRLAPLDRPGIHDVTAAVSERRGEEQHPSDNRHALLSSRK